MLTTTVNTAYARFGELRVQRGHLLARPDGEETGLTGDLRLPGIRRSQQLNLKPTCERHHDLQKRRYSVPFIYSVFRNERISFLGRTMHPPPNLASGFYTPYQLASGSYPTNNRRLRRMPQRRPYRPSFIAPTRESTIFPGFHLGLVHPEEIDT